MIHYLQPKFSLRFRDRLTRYVHDSLSLSSAPYLRYYRVPLDCPGCRPVHHSRCRSLV
ncbi:hypothetical protein V8E55_007128 [Tylopilus felleus]